MKDKKVIVTGASSGLGSHITRRLVAEGARVLAVARRSERLNDLADDLADQEGSVTTARIDVSKQEDAERMVAVAEERLGGIDGLVNNAGMEIQGAIDTLDPAAFETMWSTNVVGPFLCIKAALPSLERSRGAIVNIGSTVTTRPPFNRFGYVASKGGLEAMSRALAGDLGPRGIRVNVVRPGIVPSELRGMDEEAEREALAQRTPPLQALKTVGHGNDVAAAVAYLLSEGKWVTGAVIDVDGGYALGVIHPRD